MKDYQRGTASADIDEVTKALEHAPSADNPKQGSLVHEEKDTDNFCWECHKEGEVICCETCPRVFHLACAQLPTAHSEVSPPSGDWVCVECRRVVQADNVDTWTDAMAALSRDQFKQLLMFAIGRLKGLSGAEPFIKAVDVTKFPNYRDVVSYPMTLDMMESNNLRNLYGSTEALLADCKWIVHNCILFNGVSSKLTTLARSLLRMCTWEMEEIHTCPECYSNAYTKDDWFTQACSTPHILVWARMRGYPYWPAKVVRYVDGQADCRFFGRHDKAWLSEKECLLYTKASPTPLKGRSKGLDTSTEELETHVANLEASFGPYVYPTQRIQYNPDEYESQLRLVLPGYQRPARRTQETAAQERAAMAACSSSTAPAVSHGTIQHISHVPDNCVDSGKKRKLSSADSIGDTALSRGTSSSLVQDNLTDTESAMRARMPAPTIEASQEKRQRFATSSTAQNKPCVRRPAATMLAARSDPSTPDAEVTTTPRTAQKVGASANIRSVRPIHSRAAIKPAARAVSSLAAGTCSDTMSASGQQFAIITPRSVGPLVIMPGCDTSETSVMSSVKEQQQTLAAGDTAETVPSGGATSEQPCSASAELNKQAKHLTEMMRASIEKVISDLAMSGSPQATIANLRLQLERMQWKHQVDLAEQKRLSDSALIEVRNTMDVEHKKELRSLSLQHSAQKRDLMRRMESRIAETKRKQWCANCGKESIFYCCWNTSYCDYPCQEAHWPKHVLTCANHQSQVEISSNTTSMNNMSH